MHRQPADEVVGIVFHADFVGNQQHGQKRDARRQHQAIEEDDERRLLEIAQLGRLDFAIDLGQRLLAAHGQDRVAEGDQHADHADDAPPVARFVEFLGEARRDPGNGAQGVFLLSGDFVDLRHDAAAVAVGLGLLNEPAGRRVALPHVSLLPGHAIDPRRRRRIRPWDADRAPAEPS